MSGTQWMIGTKRLEELGVTLSEGEFKTHGASRLLLDGALNFDAAQILTYGQAVTLKRVDGENVFNFFTGRIRRVPKTGRPEYEGHTYMIEDAWSDLEKTIYQEKWKIGSGLHYFPRFVMGIGVDPDSGEAEYIKTGEQLKRFLNYAIDNGVDLQIGTIPEGDIIIPSEERNVSVAEGIRMALKYRPDWVPWIDHSQVPPLFHVTPVSSMVESTLNLAVQSQVKALNYTRRDEETPDAVIIVYELAASVSDDEGNTAILRDAVIDKYPEAGPDGGPGVIVSTVQLQGLDMQIQKQRIQTRTIPEDESDEIVKEWIKEKFPHMKDVPDESFTVTKFERKLIEEDPETHALPINPNAERIEVEEIDQLPRELVRGSIEDWMRLNVGDIAITIEIEKEGDWSSATEEATAAWKKGVSSIIRMTATNAQTKVYKGISQWVNPEDVPLGIAEGVFKAITSGSRYEGSVTIADEEVGSAYYHGTRLNVAGTADALLGTMKSPVNSVAFNVETGETSISFGPPPELSPTDFLEWQRILRARTVRWWSLDERQSNEHGYEQGASARGDTVGGYDSPLTHFQGGTDAPDTPPCSFGQITSWTEPGAGEEDPPVTKKGIVGGVCYAGDKNFNVPRKELYTDASGNWLVYLEIDVEANRDDDGEIILPGVKTSPETDPAEFWKKVTFSDEESYPDNSNPVAADGMGTIIIPIGKLTISEGAASLAAVACGNVTITQCGGVLTHTRG